jgi:hypothetical protein
MLCAGGWLKQHIEMTTPVVSYYLNTTTVTILLHLWKNCKWNRFSIQNTDKESRIKRFKIFTFMQNNADASFLC